MKQFVKKKKFIKLGDILIFNIENHNNKKFIPDESIDLTNYVDNSLKNEKNVFELFTKSIKLGNKGDFSHQICQIKRNGQWYEIDDIYVKKNLIIMEIFMDFFIKNQLINIILK